MINYTVAPNRGHLNLKVENRLGHGTIGKKKGEKVI